jgi:hypothetical protein
MTRLPQCEWLAWFSQFESNESIRLAAHQSAIPVSNLGLLSTDEACQKLDEAWKTVFVPGPQHVQILRSLLDQAQGYARSRYPTINDYNRQRCAGLFSTPSTQPIRCLTGLAGVSKSSLARAFERICRLQPSPEFLSDGQRLVIYPVRQLEIDGQPSVRGILKSVANPVALAGRAMAGVAGLMEHVSDWFMATATSTLVVDEMQFFTQSSSASTKTSQLIMTLANLGPPLVYVANFSLVKKLMLRPQEEKDRLLAAPMVLTPPLADDPWWTAALEEYLSVAPSTFKFDAAANALELHRYTAGLFRALRQLLLQAHREARTRARHDVSMDDVRLAYRSRTYSTHRKDVEDLASLSVSSLMEGKRPDLVCPFTELRTTTRPTTKSLPQQWPTPVSSPVDAPAAMIESTISASAKATLRDLRRAANLPPNERINAKVTRLPKRTAISAESLLKGAQALREAVKAPRRSSKPSANLENCDAKTI